MSTHYCASCRNDMEGCRCPTTLSWRERAAARREREAREATVNVVTITVTVPLGPGRVADKCDVATVLGDVRESLLETCGRFAVRHDGRTVTLAGSAADPDAAYADTVTIGTD